MHVVSEKGNMNDKKEYPTAAKLLSWLPAIFVAAVISWFSAKPAAESTEMSDTVSRLILMIGTKLGFFHGNPAQYAELIELMSFPVRKTAHITEYLVFYCTVRFGLHFTYQPLNMKRRLLTALAIVFLYACTDEFHQLFVPGRAGRFTDVLIDCFGCAVVTLICTIIIFSSHKSRSPTFQRLPHPTFLFHFHSLLYICKQRHRWNSTEIFYT